MRKSSLLNLMEGTKIQHKRNGQVLTVIKVKDNEIVCEERTISVSNCTRWFDILVEEIPEPVQPIQPTIIEEKHEDNQLHDDTDTTTKKHVVEGNKADKITREDIIYIIEHSNCDAVVKKQYIGAYKENYKGAVCMVRTTRKGNTHIDIKQGIFDSLAESIRTKLQTKYAARVYDKTRGYIRLFEVDDLAVLQDLILFVLGIA